MGDEVLVPGRFDSGAVPKDNGIMEELYQEEFTISPFTSPK